MTRHTDSTHTNSEMIRGAAVAAVKDAQAAIANGLLGVFDEDEMSEDDSARSFLSADPNHPGSAPDRIDFEAKAAAEDKLRKLMSVVTTPEMLVFCGEEAGDQNRVVRHGSYLCRLDALDGTKNSLAFWTGYSSVVCIDQARIYADGTKRARHLAGAIGTPHGIVSWANNGTFNRQHGRYMHVRGDVFFEHPLYMEERLVSSRKWTRAANVIAAVAHDEGRYNEVREIMRGYGIDNPERFYTAGGTPLAPALIGGQVYAVVEPHHVTLHDSALLMPHQLLNGTITDLQDNPLDYLAVYEAEGVNLDPNHKPIPGYVAWGEAR
jgi:hypothetical protein